MLETSANMVSVLNYMDQQEAAGRNNLYLRAAFANVLSACDGTMAGFAMETIKSMGNVLYKKLMGELWNKLVASAGGSWILIGQSLGKSISNIMFSTDKTIEQFYQMRAYTEILSLSRSSVSYFRNQFRNNPGAQTASEYLGGVSLFFDTAKIGCDHAKDFADTVYTQGVWNTITNSKQNEQYLKFIGQCDSIKESFQFTQDQLLNQVWKSYLSNEHPAIYAILNEDYDGTYAYVPVSEIKMSEQEVEWGLNSYTCIVQAVVLPDNATDKSVTYQSSDESIVTVDNDGWCTPHKTGTATITATSNDGGLTAVTEVTIVEEEISLGGETTESFSYEGYGEGIRLTKYLGNSKHVRIPGEIGGKTVIAIGDSCFKDNLILEQVIIPDSVSEIGSYAFYNCTSLLNIDISIYVKYFGYSAFGGCTGIKKVTIPIDVDYTINAPFVGCNAIESIVYIPGNTGVAVPYSNQNGRMEWYSGKSIQTITYEEGIADIGNYAVNVDTSNYFYYVSEDQPNDLNPQKVYLPDTLETIGNYAFNGKSCEIIGGMSSVKNIGEYAFEKFDGKISGSLDNVESVGMYAFAGCTGIQLTKLPPKMRNYSNYSFSEFPGIPERVNITDEMNFGSCVFENCINIKEVEIEGHQDIGISTFSGCTGIKKVTIPIDLDYTTYAPFTGCNAIESIIYTSGNTGVAVPYSSQSGRMEWYSGKSIQTITYEEGITDIGNYAVKVDTRNYISYGPEDQPNDLNPSEINLPSTLEKIGISAFQGCSAVKRLDTTEKLTSIGNNAFSGCSNLTVYGITGSYADQYCAENKVPFVGTEKITAKVVSNSLILDGKIGVNFYVTIPENITSDPDAYAVIKFGNNSTTTKISQAEQSVSNGVLRYKFTYYVAAKEMQDILLLQIRDGKGNAVSLEDRNGNDVTDGYSYSVQTYLDAAKERGSAAIKPLATAMED